MHKIYDLQLPVYKQGDDLCECINQSPNLKDAFILQADRYDAAANVYRRLAQIAESCSELTVVTADTHMVQLSAPDDALSKLIEDGAISVVEDEDDDCSDDCDNCECSDDN